MDEARDQAIARMRSEGMTLRSIAPQVGVCYQRVQQIAARLGARKPPKPPPVVIPRPTIAERFWQQVDQGDPESCWTWHGARTVAGYGSIKSRQQQVYAHRLSWELHNGPIPAGLIVCHHCDNPPCVNPAHLFVGTYRDNARDRDAKGRDKFSRQRAL